MSVKRRDSKGRVLRPGETQRSDGKYEYKYKDKDGERKSVYSWRLVATDRTPQGKRDSRPLREIEEQIQADISAGLVASSSMTITLNDAFDKSIQLRIDLKDSTRNMYKSLFDLYVRNDIGRKRASKIVYSDVMRLYQKLAAEHGLSVGTINNINAALCVAFRSLLRDDAIRKNPTDFVMQELRKITGYQANRRSSLSKEEQDAFLGYVKNTRYCKWYPVFAVMLGTGCRASEFCGLRWADCDFEKGVIHIDHTLVYDRVKSKNFSFRISTPKSRAGFRSIPMFADIKKILLQEFQRQQSEPQKPHITIDGYSGFIFTTATGKPLSSIHLNETIKNIVRSYNKTAEEAAKKTGRTQIILPNFSCHTLRHTFCTRFCEKENDVKVVQEIMGHSSIAVTMDVYNDVSDEKKFASMDAFGKDFF